MKYAGLTDDPDKRRAEHGYPIDWNCHQFEYEHEARSWEKMMLDIGYQGGTGGDGWKYGYTYTITKTTRE
jgi:hypothetical protein